MCSILLSTRLFPRDLIYVVYIVFEHEFFLYYKGQLNNVICYTQAPPLFSLAFLEVMSKYHTITSPPLGYDGCFFFVPNFLRLSIGLLNIPPKLPQIPFVPNFLKKGLSQAEIEHVNFIGRSFLSVIFSSGGKHNGASSNENLHWIKFFLFGQ